MALAVTEVLPFSVTPTERSAVPKRVTPLNFSVALAVIWAWSALNYAL